MTVEDMQRFIKSGTNSQYPYFLNNRLIMANYLQLLLVPIALGYCVFTYFLYPEITYIPIVGVVILLIAAAMNYMGMHILYRGTLAIMPMFIVCTYHLYLVPEGGEPIPSTQALTLAFALLPFLLFDLREKSALFSMLLLNFLLIALTPLSFGLLEAELDSQPFRTGYMFHFTSITAVLLAFTGLYTLSRINLHSEKKSAQLIALSKNNTQKMVEKERDLQKNVEKLEAAQEDERKRSWASDGFSKFAALMRQQHNTESQYDDLVAGIIKHLNLNQGGLYLISEEGNEKVLRLKACFAYNRKKYLNQDITIGQGLVGQCYLERDYIYLTDVPQQYTRITSGLGESTPTALLIIPLMFNEQVEGVLEVASFKEIPQYQIEFLMKLGEDIGASININKVNCLTGKLLSEAQQQAEEMRAQEEEMRQNMEELSATQEEMHRKEKAFMEQIQQLQKELDNLKNTA